MDLRQTPPDEADDQVKKPNKKDRLLVAAAKKFAQEFAASAGLQNQCSDFALESGLTVGPSGIVEITRDLATAQRSLRERLVKLLGSKFGHEKAIDQTLLMQAHNNVVRRVSIDAAAEALIEAVFEQALTSFEYVAPNRIFRFAPDLKDIRIGRVRAMATRDLQIERQTAYPNGSATLVPDDEFRLHIAADGAIEVRIFPVCWIVDVDAVAQNVEEEGKWLIDVAISLLRLSHTDWREHVPEAGDVEPHPIRTTRLDDEGVMFQESTVLSGRSRVPGWYLIDESVYAVASSADFKAKATALFSPVKDTLAEHVSQGLGWLTRGRQSADRSERMLYFFTAIEALLSSTDKTAPVVQTIARHGAVLLSNDDSERATYASKLKHLYGQRSALVHNGQRGVDWAAADATQKIAENLFYVVLQTADLNAKHESFSYELAAASNDISRS